MIDHTGVNVSNFAVSKTFYTSVLATLGYIVRLEFETALGFGENKLNSKDEPGFRPHYHKHYYAAFVLDPDGYNIEAVFHGE